MATAGSVIVDTSVLVGALDARDHWNPQAKALLERLIASGDGAIYLDCVLGECVSLNAREELIQRVLAMTEDEAEKVLADIERLEDLEDAQAILLARKEVSWSATLKVQGALQNEPSLR